MAKAKAAPANTKLSLGGELALGALIAELVGTFILTIAVLNTQGNAIVAAVTVIVLVLVLGKLSGGHINPAVTVGLWATRQISAVRALGYLVAQFLGAMLAVVVASRFLTGSEVPGMALFSIQATGDWKPFFGELIGALVFGFGVAAATFGKKEGFDAAFTIGGALLLGLIVAASGSSAILNPAVALGVGALDTKHLWGTVAYGVGPLLGASLGALLYKLLQSDIAMGGSKKSA